MKFSVFLIIVFSSLVQCIARKGWNTASYKDEDDCSVGWSGYLKRLALIIFMLSGVILYYVPTSRFFFCRACHEMIDFVADGLKTALSATEAEYVTDDSNSIYSEQESEPNLEKQPSRISTQGSTEDRLLNVYVETRDNRFSANSKNSNDNYVNRRIRKYSTRDGHSHRYYDRKVEKDGSLERPFETIQIYPNRIVDLRNFSKSRYRSGVGDKNSDASTIIFRTGHQNRRNMIYSADENNSAPDSEPTNYPDDETIYGRTSDADRSSSHFPVDDEIERALKARKKLEERLVEFDRTLRYFYNSLSRKKSMRSLDRDEYVVRLIETILQSVKSNIGDVLESGKNVRKKYHQQSVGITEMPIDKTSEKLCAPKYEDRKFDANPSERKQRRNIRDTRSSVKKNVHRDCRNHIVEASSSRNQYRHFFLVPQEPVQVPIVTNHAKPMLERAVRWFYGGCSSVEKERLAAGNGGNRDI